MGQGEGAIAGATWLSTGGRGEGGCSGGKLATQVGAKVELRGASILTSAATAGTMRLILLLQARRHHASNLYLCPIRSFSSEEHSHPHSHAHGHGPHGAGEGSPRPASMPAGQAQVSMREWGGIGAGQDRCRGQRGRIGAWCFRVLV